MRDNFDFIRPLGVVEELFWLFDHSCPKHFCVVAEVRGETTVPGWRAGLDAVQARHPMLSVGIDSTQQRVPHFHRDPSRPIPLRVAGVGATWEREAEREISTLFDPAQGPLARAVLIHGQKRSFVLLVAHHSIADGIALVHLLKDLLSAIGGQALDSYAFPRSIDEIIGAPPRKTFAPGVRLSHKLAEKCVEKTVHVKSCILPTELTDMLRLRARREGTTIHGIICAAATMAGRAIETSWRERPVSIFSPIDLRKLLQVQGECMVAIAKGASTIEPDISEDIWETARSVSANLAPLKTLEGSAPGFQAIFDAMSMDMNEEQGAQLNAAAFNEDILVSNVGQIPYSSTFGTLKIEAVWAPVVLRGHDLEQTIGVSTINDALHLVHTSWHPLPGFLEELEHGLRNAVEVARSSPGLIG